MVYRDDTVFAGVAPFTGAWIEMLNKRLNDEIPFVAPFTGAWIEIISAGLLRS